MLGNQPLAVVDVLPLVSQEDAFALALALWLHYEYFVVDLRLLLNYWLIWQLLKSSINIPKVNCIWVCIWVLVVVLN